MSRDENAQEPDEQSEEQEEGPRLPEGTRITIDLFGKHTEVDPDSPQGGLAMAGLLFCIALQVIVSLLIVVGSSGGMQVVATLLMAAAFVVIVLMVVSAFRGWGGERTRLLFRIFCALLVGTFVLSLMQGI